MSDPDRPGPRTGREPSAVLAVAGLAFRESARSRVLHALLIAMLLISGASYLFAWVSGGDADVARRLKVVGDMSLSAIVFLGTIAAVFLGTNLIYQEAERRTIYLMLARPIGRARFLLGKYLGLAAVLGVAVAAMSCGFLVLYALGGGSPTPELLVALAFIYVELLVVIAVALFFSVAAHPIEGALFSFCVAVAGHQTADLNALGATLVRGADEPSWALLAMQKLLYAIYVLFPNLENFNLRGAAVYGKPHDPEAIAWALAYALVYVTIVLSLATLVFRRRIL